MSAAVLEISQVWGDSLLRVGRFAPSMRVTVGPGRSDFPADFPAPVVLVEKGQVKGAPITADTDVTVSLGPHTYRVRAVPREARLPFAPFQHVDWFFVAVCAGLFGLLVAEILLVLLILLLIKLLAFLAALFATATGLNIVPVQPISPPVPDRVIEVSIAPLAAPVAPRAPLWVEPTPEMTPIPIGDILEPRRQKQKVIARELDQVEMVGVLRMLSSEDGDRLSAILGAGEEGEEGGVFGGIVGGEIGGLIGTSDLEGVEGGVEGGVVGGVVGGTIGDAEGVGGLGLRGTGEGGGGTAVGIGNLGTKGDYGTLGHGSGTGSGYGTGSGSGRGRLTAGGARTDVGTGDAIVDGTLSADVITAVIRRHLSQIRYCYERELVDHASLEGKIVISFSVDPDGAVFGAKVRSSTMSGGAEVETCVVERISRMRFPAGDRENVSVTYPFRFQAAE